MDIPEGSERGEKFGKLTMLIVGGRKPKALEKVWFECECGRLKEIRAIHVTSGNTVSCGCIKRKHFVSNGDVFERLTVIDATPVKVGKHLKALCRCECGTQKLVGIAELVKGGTRSCGCLVVEQISTLSLKHGGEGSPLYSVWNTMRNRCGNPKTENYPNYGGRGISVCAEWQNDFSAFRDWAFGSGYETGLQLDRIDVNGNYGPANCRWVTSQVNANNRRNNVKLTAFGETKTMKDWSRDERCAVSYATLKQRMARGGWSDEQALTVPPSILG